MSCAKIKIQESFSPLRASPTFMEIRCALNFQQRSWIPDCIEVIKSGKIFRALTFLWSFSRSCLRLAYISYLVSLGLWSKQEKVFLQQKKGRRRKIYGLESKAGGGRKYIREIFHCVKLSVFFRKVFAQWMKNPQKASQLLLKLAEFSSLWMKLFVVQSLMFCQK